MYNKAIKRVFDLLISLLVLPLFLIAFLIFAPIIYLTDHGPVFYNAERVGKNGKLFKMYKFRSMKVNAPDIRLEDGSTYNSENDPRVTKIGRFLRKTSIDELPQILNVIIGNMSIVGPRPNLPTLEYEFLAEPQKHRLLVKPGITGYSQAFFRNSVDSTSKTANDNYYVDNLSFWLDLKILFKTFISVVNHKNIYISNDILSQNVTSSK